MTVEVRLRFGAVDSGGILDRSVRQLLLFESGDATTEAERAARARRGGSLPDLGPLFEDLNRRFFAKRLSARCEWSERLTASAGNCRPEERLIRVSAPYHRRSPDALPVTLAHEMCHLVVPGHGAAFRRLGEPIARRLGAGFHEFRYAQRWADLRRYRFVYRCPRCGVEVPSRKRLLRVSCGRCHPRSFRSDLRLECVESRRRPGPVLRAERPVHDA